MIPNIQYTDTAIIITIPCGIPAATHAMLMQSIAASVAYSVASPDKHFTFEDEIVPVIELLRAIMPGERELRRAYQ